MQQPLRSTPPLRPTVYSVIVALWLLLGVAGAMSPEQVEARLNEIAPYRDLRLTKDVPPLSSNDIRKAAQGSTVTGVISTQGSASRVYAAAMAKMGITKLWAALNDETRHPGYTAVAYSELLQGQTCKSGRRVLQYLPVPMVSDRWWIGVLTSNDNLIRQSGGSVRELSWNSSTDASEITSAAGQKMIQKANPIAFTRGGWFLVALDERHTFIEYYVWTDPGGRIPGGMASMFASRGVRENIDAIIRFAKEGNPSCPMQ